MVKATCRLLERKREGGRGRRKERTVEPKEKRGGWTREEQTGLKTKCPSANFFLAKRPNSETKKQIDLANFEEKVQSRNFDPLSAIAPPPPYQRASIIQETPPTPPPFPQKGAAQFSTAAFLINARLVQNFPFPVYAPKNVKVTFLPPPPSTQPNTNKNRLCSQGLRWDLTKFW